MSAQRIFLDIFVRTLLGSVLYYKSSNLMDFYLDIWRPREGDELEMVFSHLIEPNPVDDWRLASVFEYSQI